MAPISRTATAVSISLTDFPDIIPTSLVDLAIKATSVPVEENDSTAAKFTVFVFLLRPSPFDFSTTARNRSEY